jgi:hypothetical protein
MLESNYLAKRSGRIPVSVHKGSGEQEAVARGYRNDIKEHG